LLVLHLTAILPLDLLSPAAFHRRARRQPLHHPFVTPVYDANCFLFFTSTPTARLRPFPSALSLERAPLPLAKTIL
jgi:hypothetical protein